MNVNGEILGKCWGNVGKWLGLPPERHFSSLLSDPALTAVRLTMLTALERLRRRFLEILEVLDSLELVKYLVKYQEYPVYLEKKKAADFNA